MAARRTLSGLVAGLIGLVGTDALASTALEYPDNGAAQLSRGGAWLATATDPIAGFYNPAALATQSRSFQLGGNLAFQKICFDRRGPDGEKIGPNQGMTAQGVTYPETCNSNSGAPNLVPHLALVWRAAERLGVGLTVVPPSGYGLVEWPDLVSVSGRSQPIPAPQRYLSLYIKGTILFPTLSAGYSVTDRLHVGAGFVAGIALLELRSMSIANVQQTNPRDEYTQDTRSKVSAQDLFVPGAVASALYEASDNLDLAAWYRWSDKVRAKGDLDVLAPYYNASGGKSTQAETTDGKDAAEVELTIPMEARIGVRWHMPLAPDPKLEKRRHRTRDPLRDDLYDVELDLTWANNSAAEEVKIRFDEGIDVLGLPGTVPTNADRPTGWKDSFGARIGLQYNLIRNLFGARAGTWIETSAVDDEYLTVTGVPALRGGLGGGFVARLQRVDIEAGYQHIWNAGLDNGGDGKLRAIAGSGSPDNRSYHAVNGGSVTQSANVFGFGAVARF